MKESHLKELVELQSATSQAKDAEMRAKNSEEKLRVELMQTYEQRDFDINELS